MTEKSKLLSDFPEVSRSEWESVITTDLKGADRSKKLVWRTLEGFDIEPYYRAEDLENLKHLNTQPGEFPFLRGNSKNHKWFVRQTLLVDDPSKANKEALDILCKGIDSICFTINDKEFTSSQLNLLLNNIELKAVEITFNGCGARKVAELFIEKIKSENLDPESIRANFSIDPLKRATKKGAFCKSGKCFTNIAELIKKAEGFKNIRFVSVGGGLFNECGSNLTQELAFALAMGHEYLVKGMEEGLTIDQIAHSIYFNLSVSSSYFLEIAKLRAGRLLWANIVKQYSPKCNCSEKMMTCSTTSLWNTTVYDPYVNILRGTTEAMAAAIGGADAIEVLPFNKSFADSTEFSLRIARNAQLLLKEESHFDRVADPAAGSYYIEVLTDKLANSAWALFKEVESKGGYIAALKEGFIQSTVKETAVNRDKRIATRRETLLGTNQFPNFTEVSDKNIKVEKATCTCGCSTEKEFDTLTPYRGAEAFEELRMKTEKCGKTPKAFMLTCGGLAMARARAQFSCNFFACAGIKVIDNTYFKTIEEGVDAAKKSGAEIVVVCSSDDDYATLAPQVYNALKDTAIVVVAGAPACSEELKAAGITHFISIKDNVLETLKGYQKELGF